MMLIAQEAAMMDGELLAIDFTEEEDKDGKQNQK